MYQLAYKDVILIGFLSYDLLMRKLNYRSKRKIIIIGLIMISLFGLWQYLSKKNDDFKWGNEPYISLYLHQQDKTVKIKFEEYLVGAVAAEMPASFDIEALKVQAVCARTYAIKKLLEQHKYPLQANVSDDINSCQAYISPAEFIKENPAYKQELLAKIKKAVDDTRGEIMLSNDEPIDALYHSTCGGQTEKAGDVWLQDLPYLDSVICEYCAKSKHYATVQVFSTQEIENDIGVNCNDDLDIKILETTASGRIKKLSINNLKLSGEEFRRRLDLPSNWWRFEIKKGKLIINSRGYGHGVGMCQYGSNGMAQDGADYKKILRHYYGDIEFNKISYDVLE